MCCAKGAKGRFNSSKRVGLISEAPMCGAGGAGASLPSLVISVGCADSNKEREARGHVAGTHS